MKSVKEIHDYYKQSFGKKYTRYWSLANSILEQCNITKDTRVLDYGCGTGILSHYLFMRYGCRIDAVDISEEVLGARRAWKNDAIAWISMDEYSFPEKEYDYIFSSQVIEHVHNVGMYLSRISKMLKDGGRLVIGLPNVMTLNYLWRQIRVTEERMRGHSKNILKNYDKGMHHINAWDTYHFVLLLASCGFELEHFFPTEGVPRLMIGFYRYIPWLRPGYGDQKNKGIFGKLCYTQHFIFQKNREIEISVYD